MNATKRNKDSQEIRKKEKLIGKLFQKECVKRFGTQSSLARILHEKKYFPQYTQITLRNKLTKIATYGPNISCEYATNRDDLSLRIEFITKLYEAMGIKDGELIEKTRELNCEFHY